MKGRSLTTAIALMCLLLACGVLRAKEWSTPPEEMWILTKSKAEVKYLHSGIKEVSCKEFEPSLKKMVASSKEKSLLFKISENTRITVIKEAVQSAKKVGFTKIYCLFLRFGFSSDGVVSEEKAAEISRNLDLSSKWLKKAGVSIVVPDMTPIEEAIEE